MKMTTLSKQSSREQKFNFWFNAFILAGMLTAIVIVNIFEFQNPDINVLKQLIVVTGACMGVLSSVLSANGLLWNFLFGIVNVCICAFTNLDSGNVGQFLQHMLYFLPMQFVGLWQWRKRGAGKKDGSGGTTKVRARRLTSKQWLLAAAAWVVGTAVCYTILYFIDMESLRAGRISGIEYGKVFLDASVVMLNIIAQILLAFAFADQWFIWNLVNIFSILLWTNRLLSPAATSYTLVMVIKYSFYLLNSINGLRIWLKLSKENVEKVEGVDEDTNDINPYISKHKGCC